MQRPGVQNIFLQDVMSLKYAIGEYSDPFLETSSDFLVLNTRDIVEKYVVDNVYRIESTRFNKIAIQLTPQMAVDKEALICLSRVYSYYFKCNFPLFYVSLGCQQ